MAGLLLGLGILLAGCGDRQSTAEDIATPEDTQTDRIVVGFSQVGAESDWRSANTESMKSTFTKEAGYDLIFEDGQQKQANQIRAIRTFIQQEVDYIVLAPVTETGWDTVLREAKDAGIPVVIVDRKVDVEDDSLFTCFVGSDFELEGLKMSEWLNSFSISKGIAPEDLHIVNIQGNIGASAQIGRTRGLEQGAAKYGWDLLDQVSGEFTQAKGKKVMEAFLKKYDNINVVYCENDNEAFGAMEAIRAAGKRVGSNLAAGDIMILSFDGVSTESMDCVLKDEITCIGECNPLHGPRVEALIQILEEGRTPEKFSYVEEGLYAHDDTVTAVTVGDKNISDFCELSIRDELKFIADNEPELTEKQKQIGGQIMKEIKNRLQFLQSVGLDYLTLARAAGTLSGGESQRIRLTTQIGSALSGVLSLLAEHKINMRKLESRPLRGQCWKYVFFTDVECDLTAPQYEDLLRKLAETCTSFRILGSYATGPQLDRIGLDDAEDSHA